MGKGISSRIAKESLTKKGFYEDRASKHSFYFLHYNGNKTSIRTQFSHGSNEDIGDRLLSSIKSQLKLNSSNEVANFLKCTMSEVEYLEILKSKNLI